MAVANSLGVVLPTGTDPSELIDHGVTGVSFDTDPSSWGITPAADALNAYLGSSGSALRCEFEPISRFQDWEFEDSLGALTQSRRFPIIGFDYGSLFGGLSPTGLGHCVVGYRVHHLNQPVVEIYDPGPDRAGFKTVDLYSLYRACRAKRGGMWVLSQRERP